MTFSYPAQLFVYVWLPLPSYNLYGSWLYIAYTTNCSLKTCPSEEGDKLL